MKSVLLGVLVILSCIVWSGVTLSPNEVLALSSILESYPQLLNVNALDEYDAGGGYFGSSWGDPARACDKGAGWHFHGVRCSENGGIDTLRLYVRLVTYQCDECIIIALY